MLRPDLPTLAPLFVAFVTSGYGLGTYFGKLSAWLLGRDPDTWGDLGGIWGGIVGLGLYIGFLVGMVTA